VWGNGRSTKTEKRKKKTLPNPSREREGLENGWVRTGAQCFADEIVDNICIDP
jgi:hypothetical protein